MPGGAQVGFVTQRVGGVARAHQQFGARRDNGAGQIGTAARGECGATAGARGLIGILQHSRIFMVTLTLSAIGATGVLEARLNADASTTFIFGILAKCSCRGTLGVSHRIE